jgi:hypothetical protein
MEICNKAKAINEKKAKRPSKRAVYDWINHNKTIKLKKPNSIELGRIRASTVENIQKFFDLHEKDMKQYHYKPDLIVIIYYYYYCIFL